MQDDQAGDIAQTEELLNTQMLKRRSIRGAMAFTARTGFVQMVGFIANLILAALLVPADFGLYYIVDAAMGILVYFSDVGLAAALIQKEKKINKKDIRTTFTIQQILVISLVILAGLNAQNIVDWLNLRPEAIWLVYALLFSFFLSSLKTIPSVLLERDLEFNKLVLPQILENLAFFTTVVFFAWKGWGIHSYTFAVVLRAVVGFVSLYILKPWRPVFGIDKKAIRSLVSFGAPFQLNSILALIKDRVLIIFLAVTLGEELVGLLGWAERWAMMPIRFFADPVLRVTFPAYSRLQKKPEELKKAIEKSIFFVAVLVFPAIVGIVAIGPTVVAVVPKYAKWEPALVALMFYGINGMFSSISITLTNTLNATGKVKYNLGLMVMWTTLTWMLTPLFIHLFNYNGVAIASALTASSSMVAYFLVSRVVKINLIGHVLPPLLASIGMGLIVWLMGQTLITSWQQLFFQILIGAIVYVVILSAMAFDRLSREISIVTKYMKKYE